MARTTISLPDDLKKEMDKLVGEVNWSALSADTFRAEINRIKVRKAALTGDAMAATVERLQASKKQYTASASARGRAVGADWALKTANYGELCGLAQLDLDDFFDGFPNEHASGFGFHEYLAWNIAGPVDHSREQAAAFWRRATKRTVGEDIQSKDFLRGFAEGALEVFEAAAKKL